MVVREGAVDFAVQRRHFRADRGEHLRRDRAGDAVARVDDHLEAAVELHVGRDAIDVVLRHVAMLHVARRGRFVEAILGDARVQVFDRLARQRLAADHDLEAVVVRRIVAARHRDAATRAQLVGGEVHHRRRRQADVDHVAAGLAQAADEAVDHVWAGKAAVAADDDVVQAAFGHQRTDRLADQFCDARIERLPDDAADVVGAEDRLVDEHLARGRVDRFGDARLGRLARRNRCGRHHRRHRYGRCDGRVRLHLRKRRRFGLVFLVDGDGGLATGAQREPTEHREHQRRDPARQRAEAERRVARVRQTGGDAPARALHRRGEHFGAVRQFLVAAFDDAVAALAQREVTVVAHVAALDRAGRAIQRQAHVRHAHAHRPVVRRRGDGQARTAAIARRSRQPPCSRRSPFRRCPPCRSRAWAARCTASRIRRRRSPRTPHPPIPA